MTDVVMQVGTAVTGIAPSSLVTLLVTSLGPVVGQIFLVFMGAVAGAFWSLGKREKDAQPGSVVFVSRLVAASVVLTSGASSAVQHILGLPYLDCLLVCSFLLAAFSDLWPRIVVAIADRLTNSTIK